MYRITDTLESSKHLCFIENNKIQKNQILILKVKWTASSRTFLVLYHSCHY